MQYTLTLTMDDDTIGPRETVTISGTLLEPQSGAGDHATLSLDRFDGPRDGKGAYLLELLADHAGDAVTLDAVTGLIERARWLVRDDEELDRTVHPGNPWRPQRSLFSHRAA